MLNQPTADFLAALNLAQRQAVTNCGSHLRIVAGAGSGKTRVLVNRIAWLIQTENLFPQHFLAVTFTNKAANEMRARLEKLLQYPIPTMWVGTFHGLAYRMLRHHWEAAELTQNFQVLDIADQQRLVKKVIRTLNLDESRFPPRQVQWFINQQKDKGLRANQLGVLSDPYLQTLMKLYQIYESTCKTEGYVDFGELLLSSYELLQKNPTILQHYHTRFKQLLVDEFQDTNIIQYAWIQALTGPQSYLTIVGDDDQSIYGWRGAQLENMHHFSQDFPNSRTVSLEQNYRSTAVILAAANALIAHNNGRIGKNLWTDHTEGDPISVYAAFSDLDEARFITERIRLAQEEGFLLKEIAILYRSNAQSRVVEEALIHARIPYRIYGGLRFFERAEVKDALAYLRLVSCPDDDLAFERIINTPPRGIGEKTLEILRQEATIQHISLWQVAHQLIQLARLPTRAANVLQRFLDLVKQLTAEAMILPTLGKQVAHILSASGLNAHYQKESKERAQARIENIQELISAAEQFIPEDKEKSTSLLDFLDHIALDAGDYQTMPAQEGVQLMTLHAAKGLEFPLVFLTGLEEGLFPSRLALSEPTGLEEERRLCYVGITRAMRKLYLTYAEVRRHHGDNNYQMPSRFLQEIPENLLQSVRLKATTIPINQKQTIKLPFENSSIQVSADKEFYVGQRVRHPSFGEGCILNHEGYDAHTRIQVQFDQAGTKWLIAHFARLEKI
jgi:DNA helicase II / ATP-dependent DNA helicase PcrA